MISEGPACSPFRWMFLNGFGHKVSGCVSLLVTLLPFSPCPAGSSGDGRWRPFVSFQRCTLLSLSWLTRLPRIAEDDEMYAKRKKGPGWEVRRRMACPPADAHRQRDAQARNWNRKR